MSELLSNPYPGQSALFYGQLAWNNNQLQYIEVANKIIKLVMETPMQQAA